MKKIIIIFTIFFTIFLSPLCFAKCELDLNRWEWIVSTDDFGLYFDTKTLKHSNNFAEVWSCMHYPYSCKYHPKAGEHYHYTLFNINYGNNTFGMKSYINRGSNGNVLESDSFSYIRYEPIPPDSVIEEVATVVRKRAVRRY